MKIALIGNPNTGKSTVFNMLTGMRQHVGNFPGVTVDKKSGKIEVAGVEHKLVDFPGTYSIYPRSKDEEVVYRNLTDPKAEEYPDAVLVVVDASNLERNLLLFSQVYDLQLPIVMILNMIDVAGRNNVEIDIPALEAAFPEATIVTSNARVKTGKDRILDAIDKLKSREGHVFYRNEIAEIQDDTTQIEETDRRFEQIRKLRAKVEQIKDKRNDLTSRVDKVLVHPVFGYLIFIGILLVIFQFIFSFATVPMDLIDSAFAQLSVWTAEALPPGIFTDLLSQGIIPGIGGVVIFIPQIALLFFFIGILEESGYLSRVVFIMDRLMRPLGLNGKSVVPLMSSVACAIPGIMSARTISNSKERLNTILVAPLMSCSARIPVYTLLIALVIPNEKVLGFMNLQGLVLFGLYFLGTITALMVALILKKLIRTREKGFLLLEMPSYKAPRISNLAYTVLEKVKVFVVDAGKIIVAISIILWALATYGPPERMERAGKEALQYAEMNGLEKEEAGQYIASKRLENSYIGILGKTIEPVIKPLGYDWKIGISLITSFAAREVFVGSMATIYAVQDDGASNAPLITKLRNEKYQDGRPVYSLAAGASLMVFYVYAMMCMATLAVVKRETKSWKYPIIQVGYMGVLAYLGAWITFSILN